MAEERDRGDEEDGETGPWRARRWHEFRGGIKVKVGEDEAGRWFTLTESGPDVQWCLVSTARGNVCKNRAGAGTLHLGAGQCRLHEDDPRIGAWIVAHGFATALDVTPWEGLLWAVRIAAGRVAWIERKLGTAECDEDLMPDGALWHWVKQAELWHDKLGKVSKLAIDAGVAERLVRQLELEATLMLKATTKTLDELGLSDEVRERALGIMSRNLLALEAEELGVEVQPT